MDATPTVPGNDPRERYLELLKRTLTRTLFQKPGGVERPSSRMARGVRRSVRSGLQELLRLVPPDPRDRAEGRDWPADAETMIGLARLENLRYCVEDALANDVPGDLLEAGAWRGGASIFMRGILAAHGVTDRFVWVADSFQGLPRPDTARYPADARSRYHLIRQLAVSLQEVEGNFVRYGLMDDQVRFLPGWFKDTLPAAPIERLAVLRLDGDLYESTIHALDALHAKVSPGGYVIVDDYGAVEGCRRAVHDYRERHGISAEIRTIDWTGVYWQLPR